MLWFSSVVIKCTYTSFLPPLWTILRILSYYPKTISHQSNSTVSGLMHPWCSNTEFCHIEIIGIDMVHYVYQESNELTPEQEWYTGKRIRYGCSSLVLPTKEHSFEKSNESQDTNMHPLSFNPYVIYQVYQNTHCVWEFSTFYNQGRLYKKWVWNELFDIGVNGIFSFRPFILRGIKNIFCYMQMLEQHLILSNVSLIRWIQPPYLKPSFF